MLHRSTEVLESIQVGLFQSLQPIWNDIELARNLYRRSVKVRFDDYSSGARTELEETSSEREQGIIGGCTGGLLSSVKRVLQV